MVVLLHVCVFFLFLFFFLRVYGLAVHYARDCI